jgi:polyhydroxyalkanoate synthesis regulator phasin
MATWLNFVRQGLTLGSVATMSSELFGNLRDYLTKVQLGQKSTAELSSDLGGWLKESGENLKEKIENEIESAAVRMGFVQSEDLAKANDRIDLLERELKELKVQMAQSAPKVEPVKRTRKVATRIKKAVNK